MGPEVMFLTLVNHCEYFVTPQQDAEKIYITLCSLLFSIHLYSTLCSLLLV